MADLQGTARQGLYPSRIRGRGNFYSMIEVRPMKKKELYNNFPEPAPDYEETDEMSFPPPPPPITSEQLAEVVAHAHEEHRVNGDVVAKDETESTQIKGRPLINPVLESRERQALHKELLINHKMGKDLPQKSELNKVLRDRRESAKKKEWENQKLQQDKNSLEYKLMERANKLKEVEKKNDEEEQQPEFVKMMRKITRTASQEST